MNATKRVLSIAAIGVALCATARAADLYTGLCSAPFETMYCTVVNGRTTPVTLTIESLGYSGQVVDSSGSIELAPEQATYLQATDPAVRCKFAVDGSTKGVVAHAISARDDNNRYTIAVPAQ
jgi:hypothetical protein